MRMQQANDIKRCKGEIAKLVINAPRLHPHLFDILRSHLPVVT